MVCLPGKPWTPTTLKDLAPASIPLAERRAASARDPNQDMKREDPSHLADPTVELIKPYTFTSRGIQHDRKDLTAKHWAEQCSVQGGFNPITRELTPMLFATEEMAMYEALDHITAAVEAGVVDKNRWSGQLFANSEELETFFGELEGYDECYRVVDRWWTALAALAGQLDEEGFISGPEIVHGLRDSIDEGRRRQELLRLEADYFAKCPLKTVKGTRSQSEALERHNLELRRKLHDARLAKDPSYDFRFTQPFLYLKGKSLAARQVTREDLVQLTEPKAKKATAEKDGAAKKSARARTKRT